MKHYISVTEGRGTKINMARKVEMVEALTALCAKEYASPTKEDSVLIFNAYSSRSEEYYRREGQLDKFSTIFIDCDNDAGNPHIIDDFKKAMEHFDYLIYETHSSTKEHPKFRAIIPLDEELAWSKEAKEVIINIFSKFADPQASWFFSPTLPKIDTIYDHEAGREFPAQVISDRVAKMRHQAEMETTMRVLNNLRFAERKDYERNPEGWRNLPSVQYCLNGLIKGERDSSLNKACYAMKQLGYADEINTFLNECYSVPNEMKVKFRMRYC